MKPSVAFRITAETAKKQLWKTTSWKVLRLSRKA